MGEAVTPPAEFGHRVLPSFRELQPLSALYLGSVPALVRTTAQEPSAVSGVALVLSRPGRACFLWLCVLCTGRRRKEKEDKVEWGVQGEREADGGGRCHL